MKILFVEDELEKNIDQWIKLFGKFLSKNQKEELITLKNDEFGATPEQIKTIMERKDLFRVEYRFPDALKEIVTNANKYALFIIDRNLSESEYDFDEVNKIDPIFTEKLYGEFFEMEGDYFLHKMVHLCQDFKIRFYFLTAYPFSDEIRGKKEIETLIDLDHLRSENFIDKSNPNDINHLQDIIENQPALIIHQENLKYIEILKNRVGEKASDQFWYVLTNKDDERYIINNLDIIRTLLLDNILLKLALSLKAPQECWDKKQSDQIMFGNVINWISHYDPQANKFINQYDSNSLIYNFLKCIKTIASDFGVHANLQSQPLRQSGFQPTTDTVNALIFALKDLLVWFDDALTKYS